MGQLCAPFDIVLIPKQQFSLDLHSYFLFVLDHLILNTFELQLGASVSPIRHISPVARFSRSFTGRCPPDYRRFVVAFPADSANFVAVRLGSRRPCKVSNLKTIETRVRIDYSVFLLRDRKVKSQSRFRRRTKLMRISLMNARRSNKGSRHFRSVDLANRQNERKKLSN